jgi:hypothetical protein
MVNECASCGADDELLFTCSYCDELFCAPHQFPHHGCAGFGRAAEAVDRDGDGRIVEAREVESTADPIEASETEPTVADTVTDGFEVDEEPTQPVTVTPARPSGRAASLSAGTWGPDGVPRGAGDGVVNVRPMDSHRGIGGPEANAAPRTVGDWISRQTYLTLLVKVGIVALLVNSAFYGGMAVTLYGLLPFTL